MAKFVIVVPTFDDVQAYLSAVNKFLSVTENVKPHQSEEVTGRAPELNHHTAGRQ